MQAGSASRSIHLSCTVDGTDVFSCCTARFFADGIQTGGRSDRRTPKRRHRGGEGTRDACIQVAKGVGETRVGPRVSGPIAQIPSALVRDRGCVLLTRCSCVCVLSFHTREWCGSPRVLYVNRIPSVASHRPTHVVASHALLRIFLHVQPPLRIAKRDGASCVPPSLRRHFDPPRGAC